MLEISLSIISFLNELEVIYFHTNVASVSILSNDFDCCNLTLIILFNTNNLFAHRNVIKSIAI